MAINFESGSDFEDGEIVKIGISLTRTILDGMDALGEVLKKDRSKTVRFCVIQVLEEAIKKGVIDDPRED